MLEPLARLLIPILLIVGLPSFAQPVSKELQTLSEGFWVWRSKTQPSSYDDIPRLERPGGWVPNFSPLALIKNARAIGGHFERLESLDKKSFTRADSIAYLLIRSAVARAEFELTVLRAPYTNPDFYLQQSLGSVFELLLQPSPFDETRASNITWRLGSIPKVLSDAELNLTEPVAAFADIALDNLKEIPPRMAALRDGLRPLFPEEWRTPLDSAVARATVALEQYRDWLISNRATMGAKFAIGKEEYDRYLHIVALIPHSSDELLKMAEVEWSRAVAFDFYESQRNTALPAPRAYSSSAEQIEALRAQERRVREFLIEKGILDVPAWLGHYGSIKTPSYLAPLRNMGVMDDLTSESRRGEDAVRYIQEPSEATGFFSLATARDVRPLLVHEGVPGHFFQLSLSWAHPDPIRRKYYDSGPNEGLAFYAEELMHQFGFFDDSPRTRETIYKFMRLRALRVAVDIKLATGEFTIEDAAKYLARTVPMDLETAQQEAAFFASTPGQAISYQIGKIQIMKFLTDARVRLGEKFDLKAFHNFLWKNGNVPIALLRWEYLGLNDEVGKLWSAK